MSVEGNEGVIVAAIVAVLIALAVLGVGSGGGNDRPDDCLPLGGGSGVEC